MYAIIEKSFTKLVYHKNINFYNIENDFWLTIEDIFAITQKGIYYKNNLIVWDEFKKDDINIICSSIQKSKKYNLRVFLKSIYKQLHSAKIPSSNMNEDEALKLLKECKKELKKISEELKFYSMLKDHITTIKIIM